MSSQRTRSRWFPFFSVEWIGLWTHPFTLPSAYLNPTQSPKLDSIPAPSPDFFRPLATGHECLPPLNGHKTYIVYHQLSIYNMALWAIKCPSFPSYALRSFSFSFFLFLFVCLFLSFFLSFFLVLFLLFMLLQFPLFLPFPTSTHLTLSPPQAN